MILLHASKIWTKSIHFNPHNFELFQNKKKRILETISDKALMPFWKTFLYLKQISNTTIFQYFKNYGSPTPVTRSKVTKTHIIFHNIGGSFFQYMYFMHIFLVLYLQVEYVEWSTYVLHCFQNLCNYFQFHLQNNQMYQPSVPNVMPLT